MRSRRLNGRDACVDCRRRVTRRGVDSGRTCLEKFLGERASQTSIGARDQRDLSSDFHPRPFKLASSYNEYQALWLRSTGERRNGSAAPSRSGSSTPAQLSGGDRYAGSPMCRGSPALFVADQIRPAREGRREGRAISVGMLSFSAPTYIQSPFQRKPARLGTAVAFAWGIDAELIMVPCNRLNAAVSALSSPVSGGT
jgi:hypothetical protein